VRCPGASESQQELGRERMPSLLNLFFIIFFLLESVVGILGNGFIIIVLGREWVRCWTLPPGDMILASLGISCFFLQWAALVNNFSTYFSPIYRSIYLHVFWNFTNMATLWFTTWLAVFYCWRISRFILCLLLWSLLLSAFLIITVFVKIYLVFQLPVTGNYSENTPLNDRTYAFQMHFFLPLQMFILLIPFLFFLVPTILLISSLYRHLRNMQHHSAGPQDQSIQVHITTLKSLFFFLIIPISYILSLIITVVVPISVCSSWFWVWEVVAYTGISIHPAFLILNSSKLRRALKKILRQDRRKEDLKEGRK
uniref:Taste receptor type 2 n=1 Tax=Vombatus ursinus TaxID=29139 RepID=A0A4X2K717_VOMUR